MRRPVLCLLAVLFVLASCTNDESEPRISGDVDYGATIDGNWMQASCALPFDYIERIRRGTDIHRSPDVTFLSREDHFFGGVTLTTHSGPWPYVQDVPLVFYGPGFIRSQGEMKIDREVTLADLAPTLAELVGTPFPRSHDGRPIEHVLLPPGQRPEAPKLVLVVVWDGGGWNVLERWPDSWPHLERMMEAGTSVQDVTVGSSPSVTPAIHATIGTGSFPSGHGIIDIPLRIGKSIQGSYPGPSGTYMRVPTLADLYDRAEGNAPKIGFFAYKSWHLGMIGHGAEFPGGDRDAAVMVNEGGKFFTNPTTYSMPSYVDDVPGLAADWKRVDAGDGKLDGKWMGNVVRGDTAVERDTPMWTLYQTRIIESMIRNEHMGEDDVTDLFFTNYKQVDEVGHRWNMVDPEMEEMLRYADGELDRLTEFLDEQVGTREWVMVVTADHGQAPRATSVDALPIRMQVLRQKAAEHFGVEVDELVDEERPTGFWLDLETTRAKGITPGEVADFMVRFSVGDNLLAGEKVPEGYENRLNEPVFAAAFPTARIEDVYDCVRRRRAHREGMGTAQ